MVSWNKLLIPLTRERELMLMQLLKMASGAVCARLVERYTGTLAAMQGAPPVVTLTAPVSGCPAQALA